MSTLSPDRRRKIEAVGARCHDSTTPGCADIARYLDRQVADRSHRDVVGPLLAASGASGVVLHRGEQITSWGDPTRPEMLFSATKTFVSLVAGLAFDDRLLDPLGRVVDDVPLDGLLSGAWSLVTWENLLQQTSMWQGELWGKPTSIDAQDAVMQASAPGTAWGYNDVRVNLLCLALTLLWRCPLDQVLSDRVMRPLGASDDWSWHGYHGSTWEVDGSPVPVVVGGAHWGGGLFMSAQDMAMVGAALLSDEPPVSGEWLARSWAPSAANHSYGYLWWLNDRRGVFPLAAPSGRCARGNLGRHLLWIDPRRDLVVASHWTEQIDSVLRDLSAAVPGSGPSAQYQL